MNFGRMPLEDALGAILAHGVALPAGALKKGRVLSAADIATLRAAGVTSVIAARLGPADIAEDAAAHRIASTIAGAGVRIAKPFTGRANLFAERAGLATLDRERLAAINRLDERITIATVAPFERVTAGQMLATIKIIPFAVPDDKVRAAEALAAGGLIAIAPAVKRSAAMILTRVAATKANVIEKRTRVIADRLTALGASLERTVTVDHAEHPVAAALAELAAAGHDPLLVFAASAIVDRDDVIPAALVIAGGRIERLGMPVDPGNLLLLGRLGARDVIGIPSCAASPKLNGFDWVLERVVAGMAVTTADIAGMGIGGLLKEIASRPQPRAGDPPAGESGRRAPRIGCLILAAGRSTRMGLNNKLMADFAGKPVLRHIVDAALASASRPVIVVTGHQSPVVRSALAGLDISVVENPDYASGLASSLAAGIATLPAGLDGVLVALGDMPEITAAHLDRLIAAFAPKEGRDIVVPTFAGKRGNPVLWSAEFFPAMRQIAGDTGDRHLLGEHSERVVEVAFATDAIFIDVDTPAALEEARRRKDQPRPR